jgi:hypothetical protein
MTDPTILDEVTLLPVIDPNNLAIKDNRIVKVLGQGYGVSDATVNVITSEYLDAYKGTVPTLNQPVPVTPDTVDTLFTFFTAREWTGTTTLSIEVTSGVVVISGLVSNYNILEVAGATDPFYSINAYGPIWGDVVINGILQEPNTFYTVANGSTIVISINLAPGVLTPLCPTPTVA